MNKCTSRYKYHRNPVKGLRVISLHSNVVVKDATTGRVKRIEDPTGRILWQSKKS